LARLKRSSTVPTAGKGSRMNPRHLLFVDEFFVDLNPTAAAKRAGYKGRNIRRTATELMNHPLIIEEMKKRSEDRRERLELTADYVIHKLVDIVERTDMSNPQAALRGLELLGKTLGLYKEKQELSGPNGNPIEYEQRIREDTAALESAITRLAEPGGPPNVVKLAIS